MLLLPFVARVSVHETVDAVQPRLAIDLLRIKPFAGAVIMGSAVFVMIGTFDSLWALVHKDLGTSEWIANLGITLFALPLIVLGPIGGRLSQTIGPFKVATGGLLCGALFMFLYGVMPTGGLIFTVAMVHSLFDGLTVSSTGVAVGLTVPADRQAGAQGVLGAAQAMAAGAMAVITGALYEASGRVAAYSMCALVMVSLVAAGVWLARSAVGAQAPRGRRGERRLGVRGRRPRPAALSPRTRTAAASRRSAAGEGGVSGAVFEEAGDADLRVGRVEHLGERRLLESQTIGEWPGQAVVDRRLDQPLCLERSGGHLGGERERSTVEFLGGHHLVGETDAQRLLGAHLTAGDAHLLGPAGPDRAGQPLRARRRPG